MPYAAISANTAGDNTVVSAVTGKKIRVQSYTIAASDTVSLTWKSGTTAISGAMPVAANGALTVTAGAATATGLDGVLQTAGGDALVLALSGNIAVGGHLRYEVLS